VPVLKGKNSSGKPPHREIDNRETQATEMGCVGGTMNWLGEQPVGHRVVFFVHNELLEWGLVAGVAARLNQGPVSVKRRFFLLLAFVACLG
jgi:hypothetical protein